MTHFMATFSFEICFPLCRIGLIDCNHDVLSIIGVVSHHNVDGSRSVPSEDQPTRVREIGWIIFNGLSRLDHNSHFFFADAPLVHTLDRMDSKD